MGLNKMRFGSLIERMDIRNSDGKFKRSDVRGMSIEKQFIPTQADMAGVSVSPYKIVRPRWFAYVTVTSRNGNKITIAQNRFDESVIVSSSYEVFRVSETNSLDPSYLFMLFNRPEFDRYARFNSWGSARETFSWEDLCSTEIDLPSIEVQRKYVAIYEAMHANQRTYESGLDNLKLTCDALLDRCKYSRVKSAFSQLGSVVDMRNVDGAISDARGIRVGEGYIPAVSRSVDITNYKIVRPGQIAFNLLHVGRDAAIPIALNHTKKSFVVSPAYVVFEPINSAIGCYLERWFSRVEVGRYGWFVCDNSIRSGMSLDRFLNFSIPVPDESLLQGILGLDSAIRERFEINRRLKEQLRSICPVLIKGSIDEMVRK